MEGKIRILLVGIGGYGSGYANILMDCGEEDGVGIVGVIDPKPEAYSRWQEMGDRKVPLYDDMESFYKRAFADLVIISSPIQFHSSQSLSALRNGSNVLCEKPLSATVQEGLKMLKAGRDSGKILAIGYQWSFSDTVLSLKGDIMGGVFGKPQRLKTIVLWPRGYGYYGRNGWAGKKRDDKGNWILDSVASNATAHYLHNMLYILGDGIDKSAVPANITAELYRANKIENFDTAALRIFTEKGTEIMFFAAHPVENNKGISLCYQFEKADIVFNDANDEGFVALFKDGRKKSYGVPEGDFQNKLWSVINVVRNGGIVPCTAESALPHTICINGAQESMPDICVFPDRLIKEGNLNGVSMGLYVDGLSDALENCYNSWRLPAEAGFPWTRTGKKIDLNGYKEFRLPPVAGGM